MSKDLESAKALAAKIERKAEDTLRTLEREMEVMQWPQEYRAIMWHAVAVKAMSKSQ